MRRPQHSECRSDPRRQGRARRTRPRCEDRARVLRDAGFEVIYTGLFQTPETVAAAAVDEDVDAIGLSMLSGAHMTLAPMVIAAVHERGAAIPIVLGGIIPEADLPALHAAGVAAVLTPGATNADVIEAMHAVVAATVRRSDRVGQRGAGRPQPPAPLCAGHGQRRLHGDRGLVSRFATLTNGLTARACAASRRSLRAYAEANRVYDDGPPEDEARHHQRRARHGWRHGRLSSYFTVFQQVDDFPLQPIVAGRYEDRFERVDATWDSQHDISASISSATSRTICAGRSTTPCAPTTPERCYWSAVLTAGSFAIRPSAARNLSLPIHRHLWTSTRNRLRSAFRSPRSILPRTHPHTCRSPERAR